MDNWEEMFRSGRTLESFNKKVRFIDEESHAFPLTYEQALKGEHAEDADPAVDDELDNIDSNEPLSARRTSTLQCLPVCT